MMEAVLERRAPRNGYDNDEKQKYRENVWRVLSEKCIDTLNKDDSYKVLLLPSKEGIEIDVAISYGIKPHQIIAIDENPALLAHAKWKDKIPKENRFGCKVSKIGGKINKNGWFLAGANLDFCNNFSQELITEVNSFFKATSVTKDFSFFVTMAKGRESSALAMLLKKDGVPDVFIHPRIGTLYKMMDIPKSNRILMSIDFQDQYIGNRVPMLYACFSFHPFHDDVFIKEKKRCEIIDKRIQRLNNYTVYQHDGMNNRLLNETIKTLKEMESGGYFNDGPPFFSEKDKEEMIVKEKAFIKRLKRYKENDITNNSLKDKRRFLRDRLYTESQKIHSNIHDMVKLYCKNNNLINPKMYFEKYMKFFVESQIKNGKLIV